MTAHAERAHSKFAASAAERWFNCPGSVELSEGLPDKSSPWAQEGTRAHELLELILRFFLAGGIGANPSFLAARAGAPQEMIRHCEQTAQFIIKLWKSLSGSDILVETKIFLDFIHAEMFGTFDGAVIDHFGTLHVFDFKFGAGVAVSPRDNLQMIFYAIGLAHKYQWNFKRVRVWIIQPRIRGYDGPVFWELQTLRLKSWVHTFRKAVERVIAEPDTFVEGSWCHWCKAKSICPLKKRAKLEAAQMVFGRVPG